MIGIFAMLLSASSVSTGTPPDYQSVLESITATMHKRYNMSVALALYSENIRFGASAGITYNVAAAGYTDAGLGMGTPTRLAEPDDLYVWGSITKMYTGPAVLQLVEQGFIKMDDGIAEHVDPILKQMTGLSLSDHWGEKIETVKIHHLLHMTSGIPDYDGNKYAQDQFTHRTKDYSPIEIILNYTSTDFDFTPGEKQEYCSANYILLGLALASHYHKAGDAWSWEGYDQTTVIPSALRKAFNRTEFVNHGTCESVTPVHGFMESYSTAVLPSQDVWNISCAGGWSAGNFVGSVGNVASAKYTYELYNIHNPVIVSNNTLNNYMTNWNPPPPQEFKFYGMGTFNLDWSIGGNQSAYGHVGDTYGYQSQTTYFPEADFVLTVATNVETSKQAQPADTTCTAYHSILAAQQGIAAPNCTFYVPQDFIGTCTCKPY